jgi:hypothetical protein
MPVRIPAALEPLTKPLIATFAECARRVEVGVPDLRMSDASHQLKHRNLRAGAKADGGTAGSDAAVNVQLPAGFFVPIR